MNGPSRTDPWGWLENYPQNGYGPKTGGGFEEATVGVAQNASDASGGHASGFNTALTYGRSYTKSDGLDTRPEAYLKGLNFQEQWKGAFNLDPDLIFVTGWNEWIAGRWFNWDVKPFAFVDEYSAEKSRDIEPVRSWGNKGDVYYMQLIGNIRRFKGMQNADTVSAAKTIDPADLSGWSDVKPEYLSYKGNTLHRNHAGQGSELVYTNTTGRNDIVAAKVARDNSYLYFYVETADILTNKSDPKWMRLFIDIDRNKSTGWEGYDFVINRNSPEDSAAVEKSAAAWDWSMAGKAGYVLNGKTLVLKIPRSVLGIAADKAIDFEFKWSDNMQEDGNIMDFYVNGDVAPGGRFNYVYKVAWTDDRYLCAESPLGINAGLKCDEYEGTFDSIPSFFSQKIVKTTFPGQLILPETSSPNFGLRYTGFVDVPEKDNYVFSLNTDLAARLYIGNLLIVNSDNGSGERSGSVRLMPGKHAITVDYITKAENTHLLDVQIAASSLVKSPIASSMLFKYNHAPSVSLTFNAVQNYYSTHDTVGTAAALDPDGSIGTIEVFDNEELIAQKCAPEYVIQDLAEGDHSLTARATDNNGAVSESNVLGFTVKAPISIPGTILTEEYRRGKGVLVQNSTDTDGGKNIKVAYGWVDYPVIASESGNYQFRFRVPGSNGTKTATIKVNNVTAGTVDLGNTGTSQPYYDVDTRIKLTAGYQLLRIEFNGIVTVHTIEAGLLPTALFQESESALTVTPNPSAGDFLIQGRNPLDKVALYDVLGNLATQQPVKESVISCRIGSDLKPGVYLLVVTSQSGARKTLKLVKSKD